MKFILAKINLFFILNPNCGKVIILFVPYLFLQLSNIAKCYYNPIKALASTLIDWEALDQQPVNGDINKEIPETKVHEVSTDITTPVRSLASLMVNWEALEKQVPQSIDNDESDENQCSNIVYPEFLCNIASNLLNFFEPDVYVTDLITLYFEKLKLTSTSQNITANLAIEHAACSLIELDQINSWTPKTENELFITLEDNNSTYAQVITTLQTIRDSDVFESEDEKNVLNILISFMHEYSKYIIVNENPNLTIKDFYIHLASDKETFNNFIISCNTQEIM